MRGARRRLPALLGLGVGLALLLAVAAAWLGAGGPDALPAPGAGDAGPDAPAAGGAAPEADVASAPPPAEPAEPGARPAPREREGLGGLASRAAAWDRVDLEAVRDAMPNNLYWKLAVPTEDAALLREREAFRRRLEEQYGAVQSNTATKQEVRDYFEQRRRISADYVEFTTHLLDRYGEVIPERDRGLLELARELHLARLEEIPQKLTRALERREEHLEARRAWREQQRRFAGEETSGAGGAGAPAAPAEREGTPAPGSSAPAAPSR